MKNFVDKLEENVIAVLICAMVVFETVNALLHVIGADSLGVPQELAIYCYIWIAFLSAAFCAKKGCDVAVTMLSAKYSAGVQHTLKIVCNAIGTALSAALLIGAFGFVALTAANGDVGKLTNIPLVTVYSASIVGYILCLIRNVQALMVSIKAPTQK